MITTNILGQTLNVLPLCFFDFETTGLSPAHNHRVCEVALMRVCGGRVETSYTTLINPQRPIDARAFAVNHISADMLRDAPTFDGIADELLSLLEGAVLVAHNASFDVAFLAHELQLIGYHLPVFPVLDTLILARQLLPRHRSHSLHALSKDLGLRSPTHRAASDVQTLWGLFQYLERLLAELGITSLADTLRYQRGLLPGDPEPVPPPLVQRAMHEQRCLRIGYRSQSSGYTERLIRPLEMALIRGNIHLRAYCYLRKDYRSFVLKKIETMVLEEKW